MIAHLEPVIIGALTPADADRCAELEAQLFDGDDPWPAVAFHRELASRHNHYVAARTADTLVITDARRREVYWARYRDGVRTHGPAVNAPADVDPGTARAVAGSPEHAVLFDLPRCEPVRPTPAGLVAAVADWSGNPTPLVALYLRRPDAKPLAARR